MLKEQVNEWVLAAWRQGHGFDDKNHEPEHEIKVVADYTQEILNLFKAVVDKLTVIELSGLVDIEEGKTWGDFKKAIAEAQLQDTKKQILDLMGE